MKRVGNFLSLVSDITGILAFVGLSATGLFAWLHDRGPFPWVGLFLVFGLGFVVPALVFVVLKIRAPQLIDRLISRRLERTTKPLILSVKELLKLLPDDGDVQRSFDTLTSHIQQWDKQAVLAGPRLYVCITENGWIARLDLRAHSVWRKQAGEFSLFFDTHMHGKVRSDLAPLTSAKIVRPESPFFVRFPLWRVALVRAYGPIEHQSKKHLYLYVQTNPYRTSELEVAVCNDADGTVPKPRFQAVRSSSMREFAKKQL